MKINGIADNNLSSKAKRSYRLQDRSSSPVKRKINEGIFIRDDNGSYSLLGNNLVPSSMLSALLSIQRLSDDENFRNEHLANGITLWAATGIKKNFEGDYRYLSTKLKEVIPDPKKYNIGDVIAVSDDEFPYDEIVLFRADNRSVRNPTWIVVPKYGSSVVDLEKKSITSLLGLWFQIPEKEPCAVSIISHNFRGNDPNVTIREKLPDPRHTTLTEFELPFGGKLYIRNSHGNRVWASIPENKKTLSDDEIAEIELFLGLEFKYEISQKLSKVTKSDIICWGNSALNYFVGGEYLQLQLEEKLPDPYTYKKGKFYRPDDIESPIFERKIIESSGNIVWTVDRRSFKSASEYLELQRKNFLQVVPKDAIYCWGNRAKQFWKETNGTNHRLQNFNKTIASLFENPYNFNDDYMILKKDDLECKVYLGEKRGERFWFVYPNDYSIFAQIAQLTPTKDTVLAEIEPEDDLLRTIRQFVEGGHAGPEKDLRNDDGTNEQSVRKCSRGDRIF